MQQNLRFVGRSSACCTRRRPLLKIFDRRRYDETGEESRCYWDEAARDNAAWYVATAYTEENAEFFAQGARETDALLAFCELPVLQSDEVLEIGCGVGRMTRRLSEISSHVTGIDVSSEMIDRARVNLSDLGNVTLVTTKGNGDLDIASDSISVVFSYITLQHVPSKKWQLRYLEESCRVLKPWGQMAIQIRSSSISSRLLNWTAHIGHRVAGRHTLSRAWRGKVIRRKVIVKAASQYSMKVRFKKQGRRHVWVIASKQPAVSGLKKLDVR